MCNFRVFLSIFLRTGLWLLIGVSSTAALAVPITSATGSYLTFRDCTVGVCDSGTPVQREEDFTIAGSSSATGTNATLGNSSSSAEFTSTLGAPILRARAESTAAGRLGASAIAVQRYENTTSGDVTAFFGGELSFSLTGVSGSASVFTGVEVQIALFTTPSGVIDVADSLDRFAIFDLFQWQNLSGVVSVYDSGPLPFTSTPVGPTPLSTPGITVAAGASFFVLARILAIGAEGSTADASSTLITSLFDSSDFDTRSVLGTTSGLKAIVAVPEPGSFGLLLAGLLGLFGMRPRRMENS